MTSPAKPLLLSAIVVLAFGLAGCEDESEASPSNNGGPGQMKVSDAVVVDAAEATRGSFSVHGDYAGEFRVEPRSELAPDVQGRLVSVAANVGDHVEEGDTLARIDARTYRQQVRQAEAAVAMSRAELERARVEMRNLEDDLARKRPLAERDMISAREIEALESQVASAEQGVSVAEATLQQNRARLQNAREDLRETDLRAPFDGIIAERHVDAGTQVGPSQPIYRLVSSAPPYLRVRVPEKDSLWLERGQKVALRAEAFGGRELDGRIMRVAPALDPETRSLQVDIEVQFPNDSEATIRHGMYARAQITLAERKDALTIPAQAILTERSGKPYVWAIDDGEATKNEIQPGLEGKTHTEILDGLDDGTMVVTRGHDKLQDGSSVKLVN